MLDYGESDRVDLGCSFGLVGKCIDLNFVIFVKGGAFDSYFGRLLLFRV